MEHSYDNDSPNTGRKIIMHPLYLPRSSPWFELRVFYVRLSNCEVDDCTPEHLTLNHIPLTPDTILEVNGRRSGIYSDCVSSSLRRDRVDKKSDEATFVSTDSLRMTGSVRFEVYDKVDLLLCGILELCNGNGYVLESKNHSKKWNMKCHSAVSPGSSFLKGKQYMTADVPLPTIEVYVAGCFSGAPIILTKTLKLGFRKNHQQMKVMLDSIPEYESSDKKKESPFEDPLQISEYRDYRPANDMDMDDNSIYSRAEYFEEDGELSWFNAGVRVGVGIGLGVCIGVGVGVGLLIRTYQTTTRSFRRRLI